MAGAVEEVGAGVPDHTSRAMIDGDSGELIVVKGDAASGNYEVIGPLVQGMFIRGPEGHVACVSEGRRLHVIDSSGVPHLFPVDAAGADAYTQLGVTPRHCTRLLYSLATKDALLSFDGGTTDHLLLNATKGQEFLDGLDILAGTRIAAKNQTAGQNYANLYVSVW